MVRALVVPLLLSLGLAGACLAQEVPKVGAEPSERALRRASFLAPDCAFALSMAGVEGHEDVSAAVGADAAFGAPAGTWARFRRAFLAGVVGADAPELGLAARVGATGWSVGVHAGNQDGTGYVAVADLDRDAAATLAASLARRAERGDGVRATSVGAQRTGYAVSAPWGQATLAVVDDVLVVAESPAGVAAAVLRAGRGGMDRVPAFRRAVAEEDAAPLAVIHAAGAALRGSWAEGLGLDGVAAATWTVRAGDNEVLERFDVEARGARRGALGALVPAGALVGEGLGKLVPEGVVLFSASRVEPATAGTDAEFELGLGDAASLLAEHALLELARPHLGDRTVAMRWRAADPALPDDVLAVVELTDAAAITAALDARPELTAAGRGAFRTFGSAGGPALAVGDGWLVVANSPRRLHAWVDERTVAADSVLLDPLRTGQPPRTSIGALDLGRAARALSQRLGLRGRGEVGALVDEFAQSLPVGGPVTRFAVEPTDTGFRWEWASAGGAIAPFAVRRAEELARVLLEHQAEALANAAADRAAADDRTRVLRAVDEIRGAVLDHRAEFGTFGGLDELVTGSGLDPRATDGPSAKDTHAIADHLVTVLQNRSGSAFAVVAWPAARHTGEVYACTATEGPLCNDLLASVSGIERPELQDLFVGGEPANRWTPGWRDAGVTEPQVLAAATEPGAEAPVDPRVWESIEQFEKLGAPAVPDLVARLDHEDPRVQARVAEALIRIGDKRSAPALARIVRTAETAELRRLGLRGLRSLKASDQAATAVAALDDEDADVRTLAATFVGEVRFRPARDRLVALADRSGGQDAAAALVALTEIGDAGMLLPAATACRPEDPKTAQALAWMFQQLSPKLDSSREATVLMAVLDHETPLLRRYAIQRLGELGDPRAVAALERRLASEDAPYRPLLELALGACRGEQAAPASGALGTVAALRARFDAFWADERTRTLALSGLAGGLVLVLGLLVTLRRGRRRREADTWAALTRPSAAGGDGQMPKSREAERASAPREEDVDSVRWPGQGRPKSAGRPKATRR